MKLFAWLAWGEWRAQPIRNALSVAAIAIGIALGFAVHLVNAVALDRFANGVNRARGSADLRIIASNPAGFDESLYQRLMADDGPVAKSNGAIRAISPVVERDVYVADKDIVLHVIGIDPMRALAVTPNLIGSPVRSANQRDDDDDTPMRAIDWLDDDAIYLPQDLLDRLKKRARDPLDIVVDGQTVPLRIVGRVFGNETGELRDTSGTGRPGRQTYRATMDIGGAQWHLNRLGRLTRIDLQLAPGADPKAVIAALKPVLPASVRVTTSDDDLARTGDLSRAYRVNLDMLALMALFTGAFLVYSTQSLAVARRRAQIGLLRVVGVKRWRVVMQVVVEGLLQGLAGGTLGLLIGFGFATLALRWFGGDLGGGYFNAVELDRQSLIRAAPAAAVFFGLGLLAALAGSVLPARAAAREAPTRALRSTGTDLPAGRGSPWIALLLVAGGAACAFLPAYEELPLYGYASIALLLFGGIAAMPWLARRLLAPFAGSKREWSVPMHLAIRRLYAAPTAASVALCGLVASASLMVAMTVMIASFRHSVDDWLGQVLSSDLYLRTSNVGGEGLDDDVVAKLAQLPGVAGVDPQKSIPLSLSPARPSVVLLVRTIDAQDPQRSIPLIRSVPVSGPDVVPVWVSEAIVDLYHAAPGQPIDLPIEIRSRSPVRFVVAGVWRDYARQFGSIVMRRADYARVTGDTHFSDAAIRLKPGASPAAVIDAVRDALPDEFQQRAEFARPGEIRTVSLAIFDRSFAVTYVLQAVAIIIGLAGVAATFSAQTLARAKEFGMLRHIGVDRRQVIRELGTEGALLGLLGVIAGAVLGGAMSQVLIHVVNPQSFHWTMDTAIPFVTLTAVALALVLASAGTAVVSGRRAMSGQALLAVREDW